ncbi:MAG: FAD:protein FMN transferase, partial [Planctomycetota bacterium]
LEASERAVRAVEAAEARLSTWREDTELDRLNRAPVGETVELSGELARDLAEALRWWRETGGAFDPGCGALVEAWGLRAGGRLPSAGEIRSAREAGIAHLALGGRSAVRGHERLRIEEGGFGKGAGLDDALAALEASGASRAVVDLGGHVAVHGRGPFLVGIAGPDRRDEPLLLAEIDRGSLSTSGNSERSFAVGGRSFGHLLDPRTGEPAPDFGSVTVWARSATDADCLSTGLFVLGPDAALAWAVGRPGIDVLVIERASGALRARATAGFRGRLRPLGPDVRLEFLRAGTPPRARNGAP